MICYYVRTSATSADKLTRIEYSNKMAQTTSHETAKRRQAFNVRTHQKNKKKMAMTVHFEVSAGIIFGIDVVLLDC